MMSDLGHMVQATCHVDRYALSPGDVRLGEIDSRCDGLPAVRDRHLVTGVELTSPPGLHLAIDADHRRCDKFAGLPASLGKVGELEILAEPDHLVVMHTVTVS
mgnify:FL=1